MDVMPRVGLNLRRLRSERGLSLERLARAALVSRAMLGQIELGQSTPTIKTLWKIARALDVPFSALLHDAETSGTSVLRAAKAKLLSNRDRSFTSRALFPFGKPTRVEFYELRLAPHGVENAVAHAAGTNENLVVNRGRIEVEVGAERNTLSIGDAIVFTADVPHVYRNLTGREAVLYLVMTYPGRGA